jgi:hypothetical protein
MPADRPGRERRTRQSLGSRADRRGDAATWHGIPVTCVYHRDEGHGPGRPENRRSFKAVIEAFLAAHLSGRCESVGDHFTGSTIEFKAGR